MTIEVPNSSVTGNPDLTTAAVFDVIRTLDGHGDAGDETVNSAAASDESEAAPAARQPSERLNVGLEERLIDLNVLGRRSMAQRRILGCIGCKLATQPGNTGSVRSQEIAECNGMNNSGVRRILARLTRGGFLKTEKHEEDTRAGKPPDHFRLTGRAVEYAFKRALEIPEECGLDQTGASRRFNGEGEAMLVEAGVFEVRGSTPRAILGCLACKQETGDGVYINGLYRCAGIPKSHALKVLRRMTDGGVLNAEEEPVWPGGRRLVYTPADTDLGRRIAEVAEKPQQCGMEDNK